MSDVVDRANEVQESFTSAGIAEVIKGLVRVAEVLTDESSEQGKCIDCGRPISKGRILAMPHAVRCIDCQNELETPSNSPLAGGGLKGVM